MTYHSVAEILEMIDQAHQHVYERVQGLSEAQLTFHPPGGAWTIAQIVEHLGIVAGQFLRLTNKLLKQAEEIGAKASPDLQIPPVVLDASAASRERKLPAPESALPQGNVSVAESVEKIRQAHAGLLALQPRLEATDLSQVSLPHFAFGQLNPYQWLVLSGVHEERHLQQIEEVMASPGFPA